MLSNEELILINGGSDLSSMMNAFVRLASITIEIGKMLGSSIRKIVYKLKR